MLYKIKIRKNSDDNIPYLSANAVALAYVWVPFGKFSCGDVWQKISGK